MSSRYFHRRLDSTGRREIGIRISSERVCYTPSHTVESFYCSPPNVCFNEIAGFKTSPRSYFLAAPRHYQSIDLRTQENIWILCFQLYPSLCRAAMKRLLEKIAGFVGGYRRISRYCSGFNINKPHCQRVDERRKC